MATQVKWGVLGCAGIAQKVCVAISEASNATCCAAASRDKAKAEAFVAENCPGAKAYGSYDELLADEEIQAVYIPLPTGVRSEWILKAAAKKKHILCEKPIATNTKDTIRIIEACKAAGVQFMDNTMMMHNDRTDAMLKVFDDKELFGTPKHVTSCFTIPFGNESKWASDNIRMQMDTEPLGALGDLGWYNTRFTLSVFGYEDAESVSCNFLEKTDQGVPLHVVATLKFSGGRSATFDCSFKHGLHQMAEVTSEKCHLRVDDFIIPAKEDVCSFTVYKDAIGPKAITFSSEVVKSEQFQGKAQHSKLIEKFSSIVTTGELEEFWPKIAQQTNLLLLAMVASAKQDGAWLKPRMGSKGKGKGKDMAQPEVKVRKAHFSKVESIVPDSKGLNLEVKVVSVKVEPGECTAVVGDASGVVTWSSKEEPQMKVFQGLSENASLILRNAHVRMIKGFINLQVSKWGKVECCDEAFEFTPNKSKDVSAVEYELANM